MGVEVHAEDASPFSERADPGLAAVKLFPHQPFLLTTATITYGRGSIKTKAFVNQRPRHPDVVSGESGKVSGDPARSVEEWDTDGVRIIVSCARILRSPPF